MMDYKYSNMSIKEVLENLGYDLKDCGSHYRSRALFRDGQNENSLAIYKDSNVIIDFVSGERMNLQRLVALTLNLPTKIAAQEWLDKNNVRLEPKTQEPKLSEPKIFPAEWITNLIPDHSYWLNRGISEEVMKEFKGGVWIKDGAFKGYYVFPVFDYQNRLVGIAGRNIDGSPNKPKWKLKGGKKLWKYPLFLNHKDILQSKKIVLVESIGNCLALYNAGWKSVIVMFGIDLSFEIVNYLLKIDPHHIVVSTDNDGGTGNEAAIKIQNKLCKYFDRQMVKIAHPHKKDFADQDIYENINWIKKYVSK